MANDPGTVYRDDDSIPDDELIYRMVIESNTKWSDTGEALRAATNAFQDRREEDLEELGVPAVAVSVYIASEMAARNVTPADLVSRWGEKYGVASITAGEVRHGQGVIRWSELSLPADDQHGQSEVALRRGEGR